MEQREDKEDGVCPSESNGKEDGVCPSESNGKEDGVCPSESTLRHQHEDQSKVQREPEPESSSTESEAESGFSSWSFRSDMSKDIIIDFKSGQLSAVRSPVGSDSSSVHSYASCGSNRSTDVDLDFNFRRPTPPESYRRTYEELLQHQQEVIRRQEALLRHQEALLRHQEVQRQQEVQLRQQEVQHLHEVIRQQEIQLQAERKAKWKAKQKAQEAKREAQDAKRQLKLKHLEDQQHLKSGKNHSHESKRKPPEMTPSSPYIEILDLIRSPFGYKPKPPEYTLFPDIDILDLIGSPFDYKPKHPEMTPSLPLINISDPIGSSSEDEWTLAEPVSSSSEVESSNLSED